MDCMFESTAKGMAVMWHHRCGKYIRPSLFASRIPMLDKESVLMSSDYLPFLLGGRRRRRPGGLDNSFPPWDPHDP